MAVTEKLEKPTLKGGPPGLTPDPIGISGGLNMYSYAGQNPINYTDPWGLMDYSCPLTLIIVEEAGQQNLFWAALNHSILGLYDYKRFGRENDTFVIGRVIRWRPTSSVTGLRVTLGTRQVAGPSCMATAPKTIRELS